MSHLAVSVPGVNPNASYVVTLPSGWTVASGNPAATVALPSAITIVADRPECHPTAVPTLTPTPPPPPPCSRYHTITYNPAAILRPEPVTDASGASVYLPSSESAELPRLRSDQRTFAFHNDRSFAFDPDNDVHKRDLSAANETNLTWRLVHLDSGREVAKFAMLANHRIDHGAMVWGPVWLSAKSAGLATVDRQGEWRERPAHESVAPRRLRPVITLAAPLAPGRYRFVSASFGASQGRGDGYSLPDHFNGEPADLDCPEGVREESFYFEVEDAPLTVTIQRATMAGDRLPPVPVANATITLQGALSGQETITTNAEGVASFPWSERVAAGRQITVVPSSVPGVDEGAGSFVWKIEQTCGRAAATAELDGARYGPVSGPCEITFTYVPVPVFEASVDVITDLSNPLPRPFAGTARVGAQTWALSSQVQLHTSNGSWNQTVAVPASGLVRITPPVAQARAWVTNHTTLELKVVSANISVGGSAASWICNQRSLLAGERGTIVDDPLHSCWQARQVHLDPAGPSRGTEFLYANSSLVSIIMNGGVVEPGGAGVAGAVVGIEVKNADGTTRLNTSSTTSASGGFLFAWAVQSNNHPAMTATLSLSSMPAGRTLVDVRPGTSIPATLSTPVRVSDTLRWNLPRNMTQNAGSPSNMFVLNGAPPPPPPPPATGELRLWMHSRHDPEGGVYRSEGAEVTWPQGEVLDFAPAVELDEAPWTSTDYTLRQRIVGWRYVSSLGKAATAPDAFGRKGCRERDEPKGALLDLAEGLTQGCWYAYHEQPGSGQMARQGHALWSVIRPRSMREEVYTYQLPALQGVDLELEVAVVSEVLTLEGSVALGPDGRPLRRTDVLRGSFAIGLVTPRTAR